MKMFYREFRFIPISLKVRVYSFRSCILLLISYTSRAIYIYFIVLVLILLLITKGQN